MTPDPIQEVLDHSRRMLDAGADRFEFPAAVVMDLLDQADHLSEIHRYDVEYGAHAVLNFLPDDAARERFFALIGATPNARGIYELPRGEHTGCFWRNGDRWSWFIRMPDGTCR